MKTLIVLPDGREISSGNILKTAISSFQLTQQVNDGQELYLGSVCSNMAEIQIITKDDRPLISAGDELKIYSVEDNGMRYPLGLFTCEKPTSNGRRRLKVTAYDRVSWLDKDLTGWLAGLSGWPYSLYQMAQMVCAECGLTLTTADIPNGSHLVRKFSAEGITGRNIIRWVAQAAGRFCRAAADGEIEFAWYQPSAVGIGSLQPPHQINTSYANGTLTVEAPCVTSIYTGGGLQLMSQRMDYTYDNGNLTITEKANPEVIPYYSGGLSHEDYSVDTIQKVQIQFSDSDVGTVWPNVPGERNTYRITGNYLLTAETAEELIPVAKNIYEQMRHVSFTPCKVSIPATNRISAGDIVTITDTDGKTYLSYVMKKTRTGGKDVIACTGSKSRTSTTAVNSKTFQALSGKVLNLRTDVDGLKVENKDMTGKLASIDLNIDGIKSTVSATQNDVSDLQTQMTEVTQSASELTITVQGIVQNGVDKVTTKTGYTFNEDGLRISKSGEEMTNRLDNTGMYVERSGEVILQANNRGVVATDVTVRNYLIVGTHSRFEDYEGGTGCFYIGGK